MNIDLARALLLMVLFVVAMIGLKVADGLRGEEAVAGGAPAVSSVEIGARSTLK